MPRTIRRELFLRWLSIEHANWFTTLVKTLFKSKTEMKRTLAMLTKKTQYNGYTEYGRQMKMSFRNLSLFWQSLSPESQKLFIEASAVTTREASGEKQSIKLAVRNYPLSGPLGSQDPKLPINPDSLYEELSKEGSRLKEHWKKKNILLRARALDKECKPFTPSRRACALNSRTRLPGEPCLRCARDKLSSMETLRNLRAELKKGFTRASGNEFGMTVGILVKGFNEPEWRDVVIMSQISGMWFIFI